MKFGEFLPDLPDRDNSVTGGKNLLAHGKSYKAVGSLQALSNALTHRPQGAISVKDASGNSYTYVGDKTTLYVLASNAFTSINLSTSDVDVTFTAAATVATAAGDYSVFADGQKIDISGTANNDASWDTGTGHTISGTPSTTTITTTGTPAIVNEATGPTVVVKRMYNTSATDHWEFAQWSDKIIGINGTDVPQVQTIGSGQAVNLGGSPPVAKHIAVVRDHVVLGNLASNPNKIHWSAINSIIGWTAGTDQSDTQTFHQGGHVQKIVGGEYGIVFCEASIYRMNYVGYPLVFNIDEVERDRGTPAPQSVVNLGEIIWYLGLDGFYVFNGNVSRNIGVNKIDKTFFADLDQTYYDRIWGAVDPINTIVFWLYPGNGNTAGICNKLVAYNYSIDKWSPTIEIDGYLIYNGLSEGVTLDGLAALYTTLEDIPFSLDARIWQGGATTLSVFNSDNKLATFTGTALEAQLITGEYSLHPGGMSMVTGLRPLFDGTGTATCKIGTRNDVNGAKTWTNGITQNSQTELCNFRQNARYHTFDVTITGGFTHLYGVDPEFRKTGKK